MKHFEDKLRKYSLITGVINALKLICSLLFDNSATDKFLFMEFNIWTVRLIWAIIASVLIYDYLQNRRKFLFDTEKD
ncbi:hypothetical protein [Psychroflexus tropicus]|uniref:hypothetical protein n=1 Tax=Psychroflexus tropicus TaxID=197345 RepID=UPI00039A6BF1|nr:hypothetical protein [Psychroflexus tropicus]